MGSLTSLIPQPGPQGPIGTNIDVSVVAGEDLSARDCVFVAAVGITGRTSGRGYKANASVEAYSSMAFVAGFATSAISSGATGSVRISGVMTGFSGLTPGLPQYASTTAGLLTDTTPSNSVLVGLALSSTDLLVNVRGSQVAVLTAGVKGYFAGGNTGANVTTADKMSFGTETTAAQSTANLSQSRYIPYGVGNTFVKGYIGGGYSDNFSKIVDKITFSTDITVAQTSANLSIGLAGPGGTSEGTTKGYWSGGYSSVYQKVTNKITFSSDVTVAQTSADLSLARSNLAGVGGGSSKGYMGGGESTGAVNTVVTDIITYGTDTTAAQTTANMSQARYGYAGLSDGSSKGYFSGGHTGATGIVTTTDKVVFATDVTAAQTSANLTVGTYYTAGASECSTKGFFAGGYTGAITKRADKVTFSSDVTTAQTSANLSQDRHGIGAVSDTGF